MSTISAGEQPAPSAKAIRPPVEVPEMRSKWLATSVLRSVSISARTAALNIPLRPPPSRERIWKADDVMRVRRRHDDVRADPGHVVD